MKTLKKPVYNKPVAELADERLLNRMNRILKFLDREAKANYCRGDIMTGWDWPTVNAVHPDLYEAYHSYRNECKRRIETTQKLNGVKYVKTDRGWTPA